MTESKNSFELFDEKFERYKKDSNAIIKEAKEEGLKLNHLENNMVKLDGNVVYYALKKVLPIVNVVTDESLNQGIKPKYMIYDIKNKKWTHSDVIIGQFAKQIYRSKLLSDQLIKNIKTTLVYDPDIPLIKQRDKEVNIVDDKFDYQIYFKDYIYNMLTGECSEIKASDLVFSKLNYNLADEIDEDFKKECDDFFLTLANHNEDKALTLKQIYLAALMQYNPSKKVINLYGPGGTGKSTYLNILKELVGKENHTAITYNDLNKDDALATIQDKSLIIGLDNSDKAVIKDSHIFKLLVSHDEFTYFVKYGDRESNVFNGLMLQAFNEAPQFTVKGSNTQILDRMHTLKLDNRLRSTKHEIKNYTQHFTSTKNLGKLAYYLINEVPAFNEFSYDDNNLNDELFNENDTVFQFIHDILEIDEIKNQEILPVSHLYQIYKEYLRENNPSMKPMSQKKFLIKSEDHLESLNYKLSDERQRKRGSYFRKRGQYNPKDILQTLDLDDLTLKETMSRYFINKNKIDKTQKLINHALSYKDDLILHSKVNDLKDAINNDDKEEIQRLKQDIKKELDLNEEISQTE